MHAFPPLPLNEWQETRSTLQAYVLLGSRIRSALSPAEKHWGHDNMRLSATGLTTTPIPGNRGAGAALFSLSIDLTSHRLRLDTSNGCQFIFPLGGQSPAAVCEEVLGALGSLGIEPPIDRGLFKKNKTGTYDPVHAARFWQALSRIHRVFQQFRAGLREETSAVQFWPDHFDLAMLWFSGRRVPGEDPADAEMADEQMNFGFSTGDEGIPEAYFYITAYPLPEALPKMKVPEGAIWQSEGWQGAVLRYQQLTKTKAPEQQLLKFFTAVQKEGAKYMK